MNLMSAIGPKRTSLVALHMSAFGGKADMAFGGMSLSGSLLGVKRTWLFALQMSAYDPKRTSALPRAQINSAYGVLHRTGADVIQESFSGLESALSGGRGSANRL